MSPSKQTNIDEDIDSLAPEKFFSSASDRNDVLASYRQWLVSNKPVYVKYFSLLAILFMAFLIPFDFILFPDAGLLYARLRVITIIVLLLNVYILSKSRFKPPEVFSKDRPLFILMIPGLLLFLTYEYWLFEATGPAYTIVLIANFMVVFIATFFYHRFWQEQYIINTAGIIGLIVISTIRPDLLIDSILLAIFHIASVVLAFFFRRQFVGSMYVINLKRARRELLAAKERAEVSDRLKSVFLSTMSHEVRTPLNVILGYTDLLQMSIGDNLTNEQKDFVDIINQGTTRLIRLMDDILDISRIESGKKMSLHSQKLKADGLVRQAVSEISVSAKEKELAVIENYQCPDIIFNVDEIRMQQVLGNILNNAIKFTKAGSISIVTEYYESNYHVKIIDTGIGINQEFLPNIFTAFKQAEEGFSRSYEGIGLGLTISHRLISAMDGKIEIDSTLSKGSTFTVIIPAERENGKEAKEQSVISPKIILDSDMANMLNVDKPVKLLVLEDNPANIKYISFLLKKLGYECVAIDSGPAALEKIEEINPLCMLIDISLSEEMDGIEFLKQVREKEQFKNTPAIAVTAHAMKGMREDLLKKGFSDYLSKPFTVNSLSKILSDNLE